MGTDNVTTDVFSRVGNATVGSGELPATSQTDDEATRAWQRGALSASREQLLALARAKVTRLMQLEVGWDGHRGRPTGALSAMVLNGLLDQLVTDDDATPQIAPTADGGLQVEWLASGDSLRIDVTAGGEVYLEAEDAGGNILIDGEFNFRSPDALTLGQAKEYLKKLSHRVTKRVWTF